MGKYPEEGMRKDFGGADNVPFLVVGSGYTDTVNFQNYTKLYILMSYEVFFMFTKIQLK